MPCSPPSTTWIAGWAVYQMARYEITIKTLTADGEDAKVDVYKIVSANVVRCALVAVMQAEAYEEGLRAMLERAEKRRDD